MPIFHRPVLHDLGFGHFFPELCKLLRASILHLSSHYQESVLGRCLWTCTSRSEQTKKANVNPGNDWQSAEYNHVINKQIPYSSEKCPLVFLKYRADVGRVTAHVVPPCKDTTMSTQAPGSQLLLLGLTLYFSGAVVLTCRGHKKTLRTLNQLPATITHLHCQIAFQV